MVQPAGGTGMVNDGPWALFRLFERVKLQPGSERREVPRHLRHRRPQGTVFDITASSVRNPFRLRRVAAARSPARTVSVTPGSTRVELP
jgi:type VI secretion system protein ImpL